MRNNVGIPVLIPKKVHKKPITKSEGTAAGTKNKQVEIKTNVDITPDQPKKKTKAVGIEDYKKFHQEKLRKQQEEAQQKQNYISKLRSDMSHSKVTISEENLQYFDIPSASGNDIVFNVNCMQFGTFIIQMKQSHTTTHLRTIVEKLCPGLKIFSFLTNSGTNFTGEIPSSLQEEGIRSGTEIIALPRSGKPKFP